MSLAHLAVRLPSNAGTLPALELRTGASVGFSLLEILLITSSSSASSMGFGRPGAIGVAPSGLLSFTRALPGDPSVAAFAATNWGTNPTVPATFAKRWNTPGVAGAGADVMWTFPGGFVVLPGASVVLWALTTNVTHDCNIVIDE